ncbi:MAG: HD domain-containing protein [Thermodesulfobacteriota bacterium]|nr:HD domain-containing protein [Thermodesulfobacteriota bacterium]
MIPSVEVCFRLMDKYQMLENIKAHSLTVAGAAYLIAGGLRDAGLDLSVEKTIAGALLHDIGKTASLKTGEDHSEMGRQICLQNHLDEIANIVGEHVILKSYDLNTKCSEKEIVFYADKRVNDDRIVTLEERLAYIIGRYGRNQERICKAIRMNFDLCKKIETKLFSKLDFSPDSLPHLVDNAHVQEISDCFLHS